jgi:hypothetical protein
MDKIFIIIGETGEYDDSVYWVVGAFFDKEVCLRYRDKLNNFLSENGISNSVGGPSQYKRPEHFIDPDLANYFGRGYGVEYKIQEIEILDSK